MERIKQIRKTRGRSLTDVAEKSGLHREAIARAERSDTDPRASTVASIAKALDVPVCELFEESGHGRQGQKPKGKR